MTSNIKSLTQSYKAIKAKKKQKREQVPAVVFDEDARREFLTGFHKRKLAKKEESKKKALAREKQERLEARRECRANVYDRSNVVSSRSKLPRTRQRLKRRTVDFVQNTESDDEEWNGIASAPSNDAGLEQEKAYSDEEQLATVTIVEDFDPSTLIHGPTPSEPQAESPPLPLPSSRRRRSGERVRGVEEDRRTSKRKNTTVRYETKAARKATQAKQRARRTEKAELAGGKAARKMKAGRKKRR
ncbi:nucleolar protein 12-domain-containing protein [Lactarius psammicola]|nr:nucleolar protein 12-domain-containing protein [Lactarius psammicola]